MRKSYLYHFSMWNYPQNYPSSQKQKILQECEVSTIYAIMIIYNLFWNWIAEEFFL